jgi:hypothetical protein
VAVPILIFIACLAAGAFAGARWVPGLEQGPVGGLAFFVVCGLIGAGLGVIGLNIYEIVESGGGLSSTLKREVVGDGLRSMLFEGGTLFALATAVYLLAPPPVEPDEAGLGSRPQPTDASG